jgi:6-pyruvoyltetrahydropterin/6-carboxytetrahydropterin synthase
MIARIAKHFTFDAAHRLDGLPADHMCSRMHGHTYRVSLQLVGPVDPLGFVVDYADIATAWHSVHKLVDHRILNEVAGLEQPTTENLAVWIIRELAPHPTFVRFDVQSFRWTLLERVRIYESSTTWCEITTDEVHATFPVSVPKSWISRCSTV